MEKSTLVLFWIMWLIDVLIALLGYREFIGGVFGRYAAPTMKYVTLWVLLLLAMLLLIGGSLYFKNHGKSAVAMSIAAIPLVLALPYALFLAVVMMGGKNNWQ